MCWYPNVLRLFFMFSNEGCHPLPNAGIRWGPPGPLGRALGPPSPSSTSPRTWTSPTSTASAQITVRVYCSSVRVTPDMKHRCLVKSEVPSVVTTVVVHGVRWTRLFIDHGVGVHIQKHVTDVIQFVNHITSQGPNQICHYLGGFSPPNFLFWLTFFVFECEFFLYLRFPRVSAKCSRLWRAYWAFLATPPWGCFHFGFWATLGDQWLLVVEGISFFWSILQCCFSSWWDEKRQFLVFFCLNILRQCKSFAAIVKWCMTNPAINNILYCFVFFWISFIFLN